MKPAYKKKPCVIIFRITLKAVMFNIHTRPGNNHTFFTKSQFAEQSHIFFILKKFLSGFLYTERILLFILPKTKRKVMNIRLIFTVPTVFFFLFWMKKTEIRRFPFFYWIYAAFLH